MKSFAFAAVAAFGLLGGCALIDQLTQDRTAQADCAAGKPEDGAAVQSAPQQLSGEPAWSQCSALCENVAAARVRLAKAECTMPVNESESLLAYYGRLHKLGGTELVNEHETVRQLFARTRTDSVRVRYAMVLSIPGTPFNNELRALETLRPVLNNTAASLHSLAMLINSQIEAQRREQELSQKLDALKSLDKSLIERRLY